MCNFADMVEEISEFALIDSTSTAPSLPSAHAFNLATEYAAVASDAHKKDLGQFFTPVELGAHIAGLSTFSGVEVRLLDPGFGSGILACALIEHLVATNSGLAVIHLDAYDIDIGVQPYAQDVLGYLAQWLEARHIILHAHLLFEDFILSQAVYWQLPLQPITPRYDIVIANPPYFKLGRDDPRNSLMRPRQLDQPNIYALFVVQAALLTQPGGELLFLIPRSFCSGLYYERFRIFLYQHLRIKQLHLFHSREQAFAKDNVLQENIIFKATRTEEVTKQDYPLLVTSSTGIQDVATSNQLTCTLYQIVDLGSREKVLFLPTTTAELALIADFKTWRHRLHSFKIKVSTGPVVGFRATIYLREKAAKNNIPLLWINNVRRGAINWPNERDRMQYLSSKDSNKISSLLPVRNYVLLRRFSAKDDKHRLIAAPFLATQWAKYKQVGLENKLNYLYASAGELTEIQAAGLSALLNSNLYNAFFKIFSGNTQVSATEIRALPMPVLAVIEEIGKQVLNKGQEATDAIVNAALKH